MTKVLSLSNKAYDILAKQKKNNESFSDLILNLASKSEKKQISSFAGKWKSDDIDEILSESEKTPPEKNKFISLEGIFQGKVEHTSEEIKAVQIKLKET